MLGPYQQSRMWTLRIHLPWTTMDGKVIRPDIWPQHLPQEMTAAAWCRSLYYEWKEMSEMTRNFPYRFERIK